MISGRVGPTFSRRATLAGLLAAPVLGSTPARAVAQPPLLLRRADHVLTMTGAVPSNCDVLIRDGEIVAVGTALEAGDAERIDMRGKVLLPGFVDTHWHMWNTLARGMGVTLKGGFAQTMAALSPHFSPADAALGVELALAEAVDTGITTVHNWAHNIRSPAHAEAEIDAMVRSGVRGRFSYGYPQDVLPTRTMDIEHLQSLARSPLSDLVMLGICARGPDRSDNVVWEREWDTARRLGLPISTHMASDAKAAAGGGISALAARDGLGEDVQLVHLTAASRAEMDVVSRAGSPVSVSPWTELAVGYGVPPISDMLASKLKVGLSVDNMVLAGAADMASVMRLALDLARGLARDQHVLSDETVLEWATRDGARSLGLGRKTGRLAQGLRADLIAIDTEHLNSVPMNDVHAVLTHAIRPENIDLVLIDGVTHKRNGKLVRVDKAQLAARAKRAFTRVRNHSSL